MCFFHKTSITLHSKQKHQPHNSGANGIFDSLTCDISQPESSLVRVIVRTCILNRWQPCERVNLEIMNGDGC